MSPVGKAAAVTRQVLARPETGTLVFNSFGGRVSDNPRAVYEELVSGQLGRRYVWVAGPGVEFPPGVEAVPPASTAYSAVVGRARVVVSNARMTHYVKKPGVTYLQTWHGTPLKKIGFDNPRYGHNRDG